MTCTVIRGVIFTHFHCRAGTWNCVSSLGLKAFSCTLSHRPTEWDLSNGAMPRLCGRRVFDFHSVWTKIIVTWLQSALQLKASGTVCSANIFSALFLFRSVLCDLRSSFWLLYRPINVRSKCVVLVWLPLVHSYVCFAFIPQTNPTRLQSRRDPHF